MTQETILALPTYFKVLLALLTLAIAWLIARGILYILRKTFSFLATFAIMIGLLIVAGRLLLMYW